MGRREFAIRSDVGGCVALFSTDAVFALDVQQALENWGIAARTNLGYDVESLADPETQPVWAAIVDVRDSDPRSLESLHWLSRRNVPSVVISNRKDVELGHPSVIDCFSKPLVVDSLLPAISAAIQRAAQVRNPSG